MKNLWNDTDTINFTNDLDYRVYSSNLLGEDENLVLYNSGNTSVKSTIDNENILFVKGSGLNLSNIKKDGFVGVELGFLIDMAKLENLSDIEMIEAQNEAMIYKGNYTPSIESILHAIIPFKYVEHTHANAIVTISNNEFGEEHIKELYPNFLIVPYMLPGFILAHTVYELTKNINWDKYEGIILHNHGIFTFANNAKKSYTKMIESVTLAEEFLEINAPLVIEKYIPRATIDLNLLQNIIDKEKGYKVFIKVDQSPLALHYASMRNLKKFATRGVLSPEHILKTKRIPMVLEDSNIKNCIDNYIDEYNNYFQEFKTKEVCLNPAPNYIVVKNFGVIYFGKNKNDVDIINDIIKQTMNAVLKSDMIGGYQSMSIKDSFNNEYSTIWW